MNQELLEVMQALTPEQLKNPVIKKAITDYFVGRARREAERKRTAAELDPFPKVPGAATGGFRYATHRKP